jgi:hypothetical protein
MLVRPIAETLFHRLVLDEVLRNNAMVCWLFNRLIQECVDAGRRLVVEGGA